MDAYCAEVRKLEKKFQGLEILHVLRDSNGQSEGPARCVCIGVAITLYKTTRWDNL
jgi:hypothetical protein